jgi:hypothetical protein
MMATRGMRRSPSKSAQKPVEGRVGSPMAGPADDQELLLQENALGNDGACAAGAEQPGDRRQQMSEEDEQALHGGGE